MTYQIALKQFAFLVLAIGTMFATRTTRAAEQPNILFLFADDQCYETVHAYGHTEIETPSLDALVAQGTTFTHTYNMGSWSGAVCVASRTMLNTGRFIWNANAVYGSAEKEREAGRFWSEQMKRAGYRTYFTGKWHVKANANAAFDVASNVRGGMPNQTPQGYNRPQSGKPDVWSPYDPKFGGFWKGGKHWSEVVGDDAVSYLRDAKKSDQPFFMYIAFNAPHDPRQSPKEYVDKYPLEKITVPSNFLTDYPYKDAIGCGPGLRDEKLAPFPRTHHAVQVNRQEYYAIITHMDAQIGRILDVLKETGQADNTYIFFTADHGLAVGHHGLMGKQNLYDHSVRVPFMVVGPDVPKNATNDEAIYLQDVMATSLELAGIEKPEHVDFNSILPLLNGEAKSPYDAIYGAYLDKQRSITQNGFKLLLYPNVPKARLYDVRNDPQESQDLIGNPKHQATAKKLFSRFLKLQSELNDKLDLSKTFSDLAS